MCCSSVPTELHYVQVWLTVWKISPFSSRPPAARSLLWICLLSSCLVSGCVSNPTPHPALDAGTSIGAPTHDRAGASGAFAAREESADSVQAGPEWDGQGGFSDTVDGDVLESFDEVGPEDGGGSTEPLG